MKNPLQAASEAEKVTLYFCFWTYYVAVVRVEDAPKDVKGMLLTCYNNACFPDFFP
jgi:hypothetical protein